ncbi:hypothetical protein [Nioella sp.]|uniref:hypothetical protein n=1 Tax=Nioella sp. TaxID=1912091 RepID=UPI003511557E
MARAAKPTSKPAKEAAPETPAETVAKAVTSEASGASEPEAKAAEAKAPELKAAEPTPPAAKRSKPDPEWRAATVASRIEHDGETYEADDAIVLTEADFIPLAKSGALIERDWNACLQDE